MTPSFIGLMATMLPGVRPSISLASLPTASTSPVFLLMATIEGSFTTMPLPRAYTSVLAVPRSIARSLEKMLNSDLRLCKRVEEWNPLDDIRDLALSDRCHCRAYPVASLRMGGRRPILRDTPRFAVKPKSQYLGISLLSVPALLNHNLFLQRVHAALGILRGNRDHALALRQRR